MKHIICYWTKTGHSKKLALALAEALSVPALDLKTQFPEEPSDTLFLVSGIYAGQNDPELLEKLQKLEPGKVGKVVLITSCTSGTTPQDQARKTLLDRGIQVVSREFLCKGRFLIFAWSHPNQTDLENAVEFAKEVLSMDLR